MRALSPHDARLALWAGAENPCNTYQPKEHMNFYESCFTHICIKILYIYMYIYILNKGSLEVKLPTIWTDEKQRWAESEKRREEKKKERRSKRKSPKKEDPGARKARKVVKSFVFPLMTYSHHN